MNRTQHFSVADFLFCVDAPSRLLDGMPTFAPFKTDEPYASLLFRATVNFEATLQHKFDKAPDEETSNDFGRIRLYKNGNGYHFEVSFGGSPLFHAMDVNGDFTRAVITLNSKDDYQQNAISSLLHILFSMAILQKGGVMTHASTVVLDGKGYMFLGRSGTGKSTHADLWCQTFPGCTLLNDDNPVIRVVNDEPFVYGTPWSGKTPCYKNESAPLRGIARLAQSPHNEYSSLAETAKFGALLPSCSVINSDKRLTEALYDTVIAVCEKIKIGLLRCRPDKDAATVCCDGLNKK